MAVYLARNCPKCGKFFAVVLSEPTLDARKLAVIGACKHCGYHIRWALIRGGRAHPQHRLSYSLQ
jgi:hypothetical protein